MTLSDDVRERLLALINADDELNDWLNDQRQLASNDEIEALAKMIANSHLLAERDPKAARLTGLYKIALAEPEIKPPTSAPIVTDRSAAWFVKQIKRHLANEPEFAKALSEQQLTLEAEGQPRSDATAIVVRDVIAMERDGIKPLDGDSPLARAVRLAGEKIANGTWRPEPAPFDPMAAMSAEFNARSAVSRLDELEDPTHVVVIPQTSGFKITDTREDRSLDHDQPKPSANATDANEAA